jgi:hypothetical protein
LASSLAGYRNEARHGSRGNGTGDRLAVYWDRIGIDEARLGAPRSCTLMLYAHTGHRPCCRAAVIPAFCYIARHDGGRKWPDRLAAGSTSRMMDGLRKPSDPALTLMVTALSSRYPEQFSMSSTATEPSSWPDSI